MNVHNSANVRSPHKIANFMSTVNGRVTPHPWVPTLRRSHVGTRALHLLALSISNTNMTIKAEVVGHNTHFSQNIIYIGYKGFITASQLQKNY